MFSAQILTHGTFKFPILSFQWFCEGNIFPHVEYLSLGSTLSVFAADRLLFTLHDVVTEFRAAGAMTLNMVELLCYTFHCCF